MWHHVAQRGKIHLVRPHHAQHQSLNRVDGVHDVNPLFFAQRTHLRNVLFQDDARKAGNTVFTGIDDADKFVLPENLSGGQSA